VLQTWPTNNALDCRFDRYYDPGTDQFLSVDPDLAETGQPYAFTGDDPLNKTDPLGLSGGSQGYLNYLLALNKQKKFCAAHPGIRGHSCGGLLHEIVGTVAKGVQHTSNVTKGAWNGYSNAVDSIPGSSGANKAINNSLNGLSCVGKGVIAAFSPPGQRVASQAGPAVRQVLNKLGADSEVVLKDKPVGAAVTVGLAAGGCLVPGFKVS